ncbi:MAG: YciI family protein [Gemmataceae bacterium]
MARFLFVYRGDKDAGAQMTPAQMQEMLKQWGDWIAAAMKDGWMVDSGDALTPEGKVLRGANVVLDGPFVESKEVLGGYSVVEAESIDAAAKLARGCPALRGGSVEVRRLAGFALKM